MVEALPQRSILRVVTPDELTAQEDARAKAAVDASDPTEELAQTRLAGYVRSQFEVMKRHRDNTTAGWSHRLLDAMRTFNGSYDPSKLQEIRKFGGSEVYARLTSMKCRGTTALLRDVYLGSDRPWGLQADPDPEVPDNIKQSIVQLIQTELETLSQAGQQIDPMAIRDRVQGLTMAARDAAKKKAKQQAKISEDKIEEILTQGGFYKALAELLVDLPMFPYCVLKGPVVRIVPTVKWTDGAAAVVNKPTLFWNRVSPFDIYWTPGVADIGDAEIIERMRLTRADLNDLLDLPGYDEEAIRSVLRDYGKGGLVENWDTTDAERAVQENREDPHFNRSGLISCLEYHGNVQGQLLLEQGFTPNEIPDPDRDYFVQAWIIGKYVIKVQMSPSPRKRHPYYITSFEKVPGTPVGNGLPDLLGDIQDVSNATLRSLVNNLSIASGPQVVVLDDRLAPDADGEELYPWKRWHMTSDPLGNSGAQAPVTFFQPQTNSGELLQVLTYYSQMADEISAIPKYLTGSGPGGGAGRTASGLAMLMGNASKILQTVAANIDRDVLDPALGGLYDMIMLTDQSGLLSGQESVRVLGVQVAVQKETQRARQLEFLQTTANPLDTQIMGITGRAAVLRAVADTLGLDGAAIVPPDDELKKQEQAQQMMQAQEAAAQAQGAQPGQANQDTGPRTNLQQDRPKQIAGGPQ